MELPIYVVDAFASAAFTGNPAGICPVPSGLSLSDSLMASIAAEMKHAETAFLVRREGQNEFELRWFTPQVEVDLCGHATLASAHCLWEIGMVEGKDSITFHTRSGALGAERKGGKVQLDFPAVPVHKAALPSGAFAGAKYTGNNGIDWLIELESEVEVRAFTLDVAEIERLGMRGVMITGQGDGKYDFVSRFFAPLCGIPEDPVTGSAHCALAAHWGEKLGKTKMLGYQASPRGGEVGVELSEGRVLLTGSAVTVLAGTLKV